MQYELERFRGVVSLETTPKKAKEQKKTASDSLGRKAINLCIFVYAPIKDALEFSYPREGNKLTSPCVCKLFIPSYVRTFGSQDSTFGVRSGIKEKNLISTSLRYGIEEKY